MNFERERERAQELHIDREKQILLNLFANNN